MSTEDISQIIERLGRIEDKQDVQGEKIENLRVAMAGRAGEGNGARTTKNDLITRLASYGGFLAGIGAVIALFMRR